MTGRNKLAALAILVAAPLAAQQAPMTARDSAFHVLNRLAYGATPSLVDRVAREGVLAWIDRQLGVARVDDPALGALRDQFSVLSATPEELLRTYTRVRQERRSEKRSAADDSAMTPQERMRKMDPEARALRQIGGELQQLVVVRADRSEHQLAEVMADFWANHFNVFYGKNLDRVYLPDYIERTIRPNALGTFGRLLQATAQSPAMLVYLDNAQSVAPGSRPPQLDAIGRGRRAGRNRRAPDSLRKSLQPRMPTGLNENYARELMELHTLGVHGGYTQQDVMEVARCLTGWTILAKKDDGYSGKLLSPLKDRGKVTFRPDAHDDGAKHVLGTEIPAKLGEGDLDRVIDIVAAHPSTARFLAHKLCTRFIADDPPEASVDAVASAFTASSGDIKTTLRALFATPEFRTSAGAKFKRPFHFVVSALRATNASTDADQPILSYLEKMGHVPFRYPTPDGYPATAAHWRATLLWRWKFAIALANGRIPGTHIERVHLQRVIGSDIGLMATLLNRQPSANESDAFLKSGDGLALLLASPAFQRC